MNWIYKRKQLLFNETSGKKDLLSFATKLIEKIPNPSHSKEHYQSYLKKNCTKLVKQSKIIFQQQKILENPNIVDTKSAIVEHPKINS